MISIRPNRTLSSGLASLTGLVLLLLLVACGTSPSSTPITAPGTIGTQTSPLPAPTSSPVPSPQAAASPSPTNTPTLTTPLASEIEKAAFDRLVEIVEELGPRESATDQEKTAANHLVNVFRSLGYSAELQPFTANLVSEDSGLTLLLPETREVEAFPLDRSAEGEITGPLVDVGLAMEGDLPTKGLSAKIALIQRGRITFEEKVSRVYAEGAVAAIIYNNDPGPFRGTLINTSSIPALSMAREDGELIQVLLSQGQVQAQVMVKKEDRVSRNVIAEKPGSGQGVVILGAHYDTVPAVLGANDNGSGVAVLLTVAQKLSQRSLPFTLRFIAFGSEELGLFGSQFHVASLSDDEQRNVIAMLNFDSLGTGSHPNVLGDQELVDAVLKYAGEHGIEAQQIRRLRMGSSDHASFMAGGIPSIFFFTDDFSRIHTPQDTLDFIQPKLLSQAVELGIALIDALAQGEDQSTLSQ